MEQKGFNVSLIGGAHKQSGKPMQDRSATKVGNGYNIAVVCDGHGANKHFRSHVGAEFAAETAVDKLSEFATAFPTYESAIDGWGKKAESLRLSIVSEWDKKIKADYTASPFTEEELTNAVDSGVDYFSRYTKLIPYGTTLLAVLLAEDYYVALMIGDGVIIRMTPEGNAVEETFEGKVLGDRVESMCNRESAFKLYVKCVKIEEDAKDTAFVLCSDGFCESEAFTSREIMLNWPKKYIVYWAGNGYETAIAAVSKQLAQVSDYSLAQDDISIAIAVKDPRAYLPKENTDSHTEENAPEESQNNAAPVEENTAAETQVNATPTEENTAAETQVNATPTEENTAAETQNSAAPVEESSNEDNAPVETHGEVDPAEENVSVENNGSESNETV